MKTSTSKILETISTDVATQKTLEWSRLKKRHRC